MILTLSGFIFSPSFAGCISEGGGTDDENDSQEDENDGENTENESQGTLDPPRDLVLENNHDEVHTITVTLSKEDELHSGEYELKPASEKRIKELIIEPGEYALKATLEDGTSKTREQNVYSEIWHVYITITEDGELFISHDVA